MLTKIAEMQEPTGEPWMDDGDLYKRRSDWERVSERVWVQFREDIMLYFRTYEWAFSDERESRFTLATHGYIDASGCIRWTDESGGHLCGRDQMNDLNKAHNMAYDRAKEFLGFKEEAVC